MHQSNKLHLSLIRNHINLNFFTFLGFPRKNWSTRPWRCCWSTGKYYEKVFNYWLVIVKYILNIEYTLDPDRLNNSI